MADGLGMELPLPGLDSPLSFAIGERDRETIALVRRALERRNVMLAYQPIVQARNPQRVAFYEALIRILDDSGRILPARDFMGAVETTETGRVIDCLALEMGLDALAETPTLRLAVNMSARSIGYPRWKRTLARGLAADPTVAERLILEITEASAMIMPDIVSVFMDDLQRSGIAFALDDFGAGYTAIRYFKDFDFDILKIDGQFIQNIHADPDNQVLTQALLAIARHFDMFTVAEFVEDPRDAEFLARIGVDCLQGYLFGAPTTMPPWKTAEAARTA
ncbi:MAG: EAL domain-containing protein [Rhodobacteraceae bacterium]|nr:EAL domain-containing protein [Paracoccaceae bacterium]